jgi:hypothetical protein
LKDNILPDDMTSADQIARLAKRYMLVEGDLYGRDVNDVLMWCITREEGCELLTEVHRGECGNHASSRTLVGKTFLVWILLAYSSPRCRRAGKDLQGMSVPCQVDPHAGTDAANDPALMVFVVWGLDIVGSFPRAVGGYQFLYVTIDKFTKWPEATSVVKINKQSAVKFIKSIICRFGVPNRIITDNGSKFTSGAFQWYCEDLGIQICYASPAHLESYGQVEHANAEILKGLKTRTYDGLKKHDKKWLDELPCALWGNRTSPNRATGETSFFMVYGAEAVLPPGSHHGLSVCKDIR